MGPDPPSGIANVGAVQSRRPVTERSGARGLGQGRRRVVRGSRVPRGRPVTGENKREPLDGVRVLGRIGAHRQSLRGRINCAPFGHFEYTLNVTAKYAPDKLY